MNKTLYQIVEFAPPHSVVAISRKPVFQLESGAPGLKRPDQKPGWIVGFVSLFLMAMSAQAATWYVDNTAGGSNNGTSWANAWTSIGAIEGVGAGDTVYISGGATSGSRTYAISNWTPQGGTSGNPITYSVGADASHNGTVIFSGSGAFITGAPVWVTLNGNANGARHMVCNGYGNSVQVQSASCIGLKLLYMTLNSPVLLEFGASSYEIGWCQVNCPNGGNCAINMSADTSPPGGTRFDVNSIHDSFINCWRSGSGEGEGDDFINWGNSCSVYNNYLKGLSANGQTQTLAGGGTASQAAYTYTQHQDGWQTSGSFCKVYGNTFESCANSAVYLDFTGSVDHFYLYNNVVYMGDPVQNGAPVGFELDADSGTGSATLTNIWIANNTFADYPNSSRGAVDLGGSSAAGTTTYSSNCMCVNNIFINSTTAFSPGGGGSVHGSFTFANNLNLTQAQAPSEFVKYVTFTYNQDFHLLSGDSNIIGQGTSTPSTISTTDKDGNPRPAGAWSIGAYEYNSSNSPLAPTGLQHVL